MRMPRRQRRLPQLQHFATHRLGLCKAALVPERRAELVDGAGDIRIRRRQDATADFHHLPKHRLGLIEFLLVAQYRREQVQAARDVHLVGRPLRFVVSQHLAIDRLGLGELVLIFQHRGEVAHSDGDLRVIRRAIFRIELRRALQLREGFVESAERAEGGADDEADHRFGDGLDFEEPSSSDLIALSSACIDGDLRPSELVGSALRKMLARKLVLSLAIDAWLWASSALSLVRPAPCGADVVDVEDGARDQR